MEMAGASFKKGGGSICAEGRRREESEPGSSSLGRGRRPRQAVLGVDATPLGVGFICRVVGRALQGLPVGVTSFKPGPSSWHSCGIR